MKILQYYEEKIQESECSPCGTKNSIAAQPLRTILKHTPSAAKTKGDKPN